jgi:hypothetical protein
LQVGSPEFKPQSPKKSQSPKFADYMIACKYYSWNGKLREMRGWLVLSGLKGQVGNGSLVKT